MNNLSPIHHLGQLLNNDIYIKREDLIPLSFGGNKARKAIKFFEDIDQKKSDVVVTYGSSSSNHCRIIANMAAMRKLRCIIISPSENYEETYNSLLIKSFGAEIIIAPVEEVSKTIKEILNKLKDEGHHPYFIQGGGHGNIGTVAFVECYQEIKEYGDFDYIFLASGTGTTQAGLMIGKMINKGNEEIIGISIARNYERGSKVILDSIKDYCDEYKIDNKINEINFIDDYICGGYGKYNDEIEKVINEMMINYSIPLDSTYTAKAFWGMSDYLKKNNINNKKILFIHTGGTPLYFDYLRKEGHHD